MAERKEVGPNDRINADEITARLKSGERVVFLPTVEGNIDSKAVEFPFNKPVIDAPSRPRLASQQLDPTVLGRAIK